MDMVAKGVLFKSPNDLWDKNKDDLNQQLLILLIL
jgi:hypothetical protein